MTKFPNLYKRFIHEEKLNAVSKSKTLRRIYFYWIMAFALTFIPATILCSAGIKDKWFSFPQNLMYWFTIAFLGLSILCSVIFIICAIRSQLFKSKLFIFLVAAGPLMGTLVAFLMSFTGIPYIDEGGNKETNIIIPIIYMVFVGLPAAAFYLNFCYYTFIGVITRIGYKMYGEEVEQNKKEADEELNKLIFENVTYKYHAKKAEKENKEKEQ